MAVIVTVFLSRHLSVLPSKSVRILLWSVVSGHFAGVLFFGLLYPAVSTERANWIAFPATISASILFGLLTIWVFLTVTSEENPLLIGSIVLTSISFAQAIGKIGCFSAGCCYGSIPATLFGQTFLMNIQLVESALIFGLGILMLFVLLRSKNNRIGLMVYVLGYPFIRFMSEYWRQEPVVRIAAFTGPQLLMLATAILGLGIYFDLKRRYEPHSKQVL